MSCYKAADKLLPYSNSLAWCTIIVHPPHWFHSTVVHLRFSGMSRLMASSCCCGTGARLPRGQREARKRATAVTRPGTDIGQLGGRKCFGPRYQEYLGRTKNVFQTLLVCSKAFWLKATLVPAIGPAHESTTTQARTSHPQILEFLV